ncbi:unnamed protein product [Effrenium voratum]|uniref:Uncharacterized protein n=1 Tax=Effrenium voratum TaxID=2562239 RepID=A0AA36I4W8_9DINO|nr:unnamed protein product [Effrenium voratum]
MGAITGTTSGTGFVAARVVAQHGGEVLLLNRASERAQRAHAALVAAVPEGKFVSIECDLSDFKSVRRAGQEIKAKYQKLFCLANNAGIMALPDVPTADGYDPQMQINYLSHFLLTAELFPLLEAEAQQSGEARVVNHSSMGRNFLREKVVEEKYLRATKPQQLGGDSIRLGGGARLVRYFKSKLANSIFTYALHDRLHRPNGEGVSASSKRVKALCAHPGAATTRLDRDVQFPCCSGCLFGLFKLTWQSSEDGAMGLLKAMMDPDAESGVLYGPANDGLTGPAVANPRYPGAETDPAAQEMLWRWSEEARSSREEWLGALQMVKSRLAKASKAPFLLKASNQQSAALRFLPCWEEALLFENFDSPQSLDAWRGDCGLRRWSGRPHAAQAPVSLWCVTLPPRGDEEECNAPRVLQRVLPDASVSLVAFRAMCRCTARRLRAGGIFSLLGAYQCDVFSLYFTFDSSGRTIFAGDGGSNDEALGRWEDQQWYEFVMHFNWSKGEVYVRHGMDGRCLSGCRVPLAWPVGGLSGVKLWHMSHGFEASWTDLLGHAAKKSGVEITAAQAQAGVRLKQEGTPCFAHIMFSRSRKATSETEAKKETKAEAKAKTQKQFDNEGSHGHNIFAMLMNEESPNFGMDHSTEDVQDKVNRLERIVQEHSQAVQSTKARHGLASSSRVETRRTEERKREAKEHSKQIHDFVECYQALEGKARKSKKTKISL